MSAAPRQRPLVDEIPATADSQVPASTQLDEEPDGPPVTVLRPAPDRSVQRRRSSGANDLFARLPHLPEEALASAAEEALQDLADSDYAALALPIVTNPATHGQILSVMFADLLERPDAITLPALLQIARSSSHPFAPAALENLRLLAGPDAADDWSRWARQIDAILASQEPPFAPGQ
jgi:hypothetical protein